MKPKLQRQLSGPQFRAASDADLRQPITSNWLLKEKQANAKLNCQTLPEDLKGNKICQGVADPKTPLITIDLLSEPQQSSHISNSKHIPQSSRMNTYSLPVNSLRSNSRSKTGNTSNREASARLASEIGKDENSISAKKRNTTGNRVRVAHQRVMSAGSSPRHFYQKIMGARVPLFPAKSNIRSHRELDKQTPGHKTISIDETNTSHKEPETEASTSLSKTYYKKKIANKLLSKNGSTSLSCLTSSRSNLQSKMNNTTTVKSPRQLSNYTEAAKLNTARSPKKQENMISQGLPSSRLVSPDNRSLSQEPKTIRTARSVATFQTQPSGSKKKDYANDYGINPKRISFDAEKKPPRLDGSKSSRAATGRNVPLLQLDRLEANPAQINSSRGQQNFNFQALQSTYFKPIEDFKLDEFIQNTRYSRGTPQQNDENLKVLASSNTAVKQERPPKPEKPSLNIVHTPSAPSTFSYQILSERNMNKENNIQRCFKKEDKKPNRIGNGKSENQLQEQSKPTTPIQNHYGILSTPRLEMRSLSNMKSMTERPRSKELTRRSKPQENDDSMKSIIGSRQKENHLHSPKGRTEDNLSTTDSLSVTKTSKKNVLGRTMGEKISPKGKLGGSGRNIKTYSRLDELLKNLKDDKADISESSIQVTRSPGKGLFTTSFGSYAVQEEVAFDLSSTKGLAHILMSRNENIC